MSDLRARVILDLAGNLASRAAQYGRALGDMATRGQRSMGLLRSSVAVAGRGLDSLGNRYTAMLGGAAGIGAVRQVMGLQSRFTRLGIQAGVADDQVQKLKQSIYETAQAPDIRIDPGEITSAIEAIVEKTGDLQFARDNIRNIGLAIQATGAAGGSIGEILAEFQKMDIKDPRQVMQALDTLNVQGKQGAFTLQDLAALGPRVITAYTATGRTGTQALREMGAALQVVRMGTGSSEMAATAYEATLRTLTDPAKIKLLERAGIKLWDPEAAKNGQRVLRPINELMQEIVQKTKGDKVKLDMVFDAEAARAFNQAAGEFQRTGAVASLDKFMQVQGDGVTTTQDSARAARDASAAMANLYTSWKKFADESLTEPIQAAADVLNAIGTETTGKVIKGLAGVGVALGGLVLARKTYLGVRGIGAMFGLGGRAGAGAAAGAAGGLGGLPVPLPVYVVNSRMSLLPGQYGGGVSGGSAGGQGAGASGPGWLSRTGGLLRRANASRWGRAVGWGGAALGALASAPGLIDAWTDDRVSSRQAWGVTARSGLSMGGAALGATVGSFLLPGIGTMLGGMAGGWLGDLAGSLAQKFIAQPATAAPAGRAGSAAPAGEAPAAKLEIALTDERVRVKRIESQGYETVDVDLGLSSVGAD